MKKIIQLRQYYINLTIPAKAAIWYTISNVLQRGVSFFTIPIYVRILDTSEYGNYSLFQSWNNIILIFATLNLYAGVFTKAMVDYPDDRKCYTSSMQGLNTISSLFVLLIFLLICPNISNKVNITFYEICILLLFYITYPSTCYWMTNQQVDYHYIKMVSVSLLIAIMTPILSLILLEYTNLREKALIYGYVMIQTFFGTFFYFEGWIKGRKFFVKEYWIRALKFNIPLIPHYLSLIILAQADRIMIGSMCGNDKAGIYTFAYQIALLMNIVTSGINSAMTPWLYKNLKNKTTSVIKNKINSICTFIGILTLIATLVSPEIVHILGTEDYNDAIVIIPAVALSVYCTFCYGLYVNIEFYYSATKYVMVASVIGAVLNIVLNLIFIEKYGFLAAGYTTLACYFIFLIMHYIFTRKIIQKQDIYDDKFIFISVFVMFLVMIICIISYKYLMFRISFILLLMILIWLMRGKLKNIFLSFK